QSLPAHLQIRHAPPARIGKPQANSHERGIVPPCVGSAITFVNIPTLQGDFDLRRSARLATAGLVQRVRATTATPKAAEHSRAGMVSLGAAAYPRLGQRS